MSLAVFKKGIFADTIIRNERVKEGKTTCPRNTPSKKSARGLACLLSQSRAFNDKDLTRRSQLFAFATNERALLGIAKMPGTSSLRSSTLNSPMPRHESIELFTFDGQFRGQFPFKEKLVPFNRTPYNRITSRTSYQ